MKPRSFAMAASAQRQRGVVLFVAMIVLIVMTLAGLALLRQMGIGTSIAGNVAFKENATYVADRGTEVAIQYLRPPAPALPTDTNAESNANGYTTSWLDGDDPAALPWGLGRTLALADDPIVRDIAQTNNTADMFIQRLCLTPGLNPLDVNQRCSETLRENPLRSHGNTGSLAPVDSNSPFPFYRVTTRVRGPRGTVSFTQTLVQ